MLRVTVQGPPDFLPDELGVIGPKERRLRRDLERHAEVAGQTEEIGRALAPFLRPRLIGIVEIAAVEPHLLDADHHGPGNGIGHGGVEEVIPEKLADLLDGVAKRGGEFRIRRAGDNRPRMLAEHIAITRQARGLLPEIIHDPEFVVAVDGPAEVHGPDFVIHRLAGVNAYLLAIGHAAHPKADQSDNLRSRGQTIG